MAVVMQVEFPSGTFLFEGAFEQLPDVRIEVERVVPIRSEMLPFIWIWGDGRYEFASVVEDRLPVTHFDQLFEDAEALLYRLYWSSDADTFFDALRMEGLVITQAIGSRDGWVLTIQLDDRETLAQFRERCGELDIDFRLSMLKDLEEWEANRYDLTGPQRATLLRAVESGFFEEPRETTVAELAAEFDVSTRAMSGRLRRGTKRLIEATIGGPESEPTFTSER